MAWDGGDVTDGELRAARRQLRSGGQPAAPVLAELRHVVRWMVRGGGLPPSYAPYGMWDDEAEDELFQGWLAERLLAGGGLQSLLDRARTPAALRRMSERSLRQWLLNRRARSQTQNLYWRTSKLLREDERFICVREAARPADAWWSLCDREDVPEWTGDDRRLLAVAWSLGDFQVIRYKADARKLSPLLGTADLARFVEGMLAATGCRLTLAQLARALELRFGLHVVRVEELEAVPEPEQPQPGVDAQVALAATVRAIVAELTPRQAVVLLGTRAEETWDAMAAELGCSPATISNEQRRIGQVVERHAEDAAERDVLLRMTGDALYEGLQPHE